jgi:uncharacterized protein YndB with AHSA1/START domain
MKSREGPMKQLSVKKTIEINTPASKVWDTLTNPELTTQYMFDCELISDFKVGNPIIWKELLTIRCT